MFLDSDSAFTVYIREWLPVVLLQITFPMFPVIISDNQRVSSENVSCSNPLCANYDGAQDGIQGSEALLNFTIIK